MSFERATVFQCARARLAKLGVGEGEEGAGYVQSLVRENDAELGDMQRKAYEICAAGVEVYVTTLLFRYRSNIFIWISTTRSMLSVRLWQGQRQRERGKGGGERWSALRLQAATAEAIPL